MSRYVARTLRSDDFSTLMEMESALFGSAGEGELGRYYIRLCCDFFKDSCFIVEAAGKPAGYLLSFARGKEVYCTTLAVLPAYQGSRATHTLLRAFVGSILGWAESCWFTVEEDNHAARALHAMLGAKEIEVRPDFYGTGHPRIISRIDREAFLALRARFEKVGLVERPSGAAEPRPADGGGMASAAALA
ncbi:alanine acetyltransferase [Sorangium cellulosum]|uniref:Alanine acetyltransferase n=1 Tax=Sorangium cellulosum TaxID=56 RepID=A0A2L0EHA1_SORCE|nr:GNAT family N-acetyltransferase [Sorangium cellulosum]AUX38670.1 alanine acetyltransferase [Sorangium cellulosum]